jgi:hypothetical protein
MHCRFVRRENGPERLVCEPELIFDSTGPLAGLRLVGFSIWRNPEGEFYVTLPARAFGAGSERRYFEYLRSLNGDLAATKRLRDWILEQYRDSQQPPEEE